MSDWLIVVNVGSNSAAVNSWTIIDEPQCYLICNNNKIHVIILFILCCAKAVIVVVIGVVMYDHNVNCGTMDNAYSAMILGKTSY